MPTLDDLRSKLTTLQAEHQGTLQKLQLFQTNLQRIEGAMAILEQLIKEEEEPVKVEEEPKADESTTPQQSTD